MIRELRPNTGDDYTWKELNCFIRAWCIVLQSYHSSYFDNFLQVMFLNWTFFPESIKDTENADFMLESNRRVLQPLFNVTAEKVFYSTADQFYKEVAMRVNAQERLIIPGDLYNIYYNPSYQAKHNEHYFIIKGYDQTTARYYILDNLHLNKGKSILYEDFFIPSDVLYECNQLFFSHLQTTSQPYFWSIQQLSTNHNNNTKLSFQANLQVLNEYIDTYKDRQLESMINQSGSTTEQIHEFFMKFNHKNTYFKILRRVFQTNEIDTIYFDKLVQSFQELKLVIPISLVKSESAITLFKRYSEIEKSILLQLRDLVLEFLEKNEKVFA